MWFFFFTDDDPQPAAEEFKEQQVDDPAIMVVDPNLHEIGGIGIGERIEAVVDGETVVGYSFYLSEQDGGRIVICNRSTPWLAVRAEDVTSHQSIWNFCGDELGEGVEQFYGAAERFYKDHGVYPFPSVPGFDAELAGKLTEYIRYQIEPRMMKTKKGQVMKRAEQYGLLRYYGTDFTLIAYYKAFDKTHVTYHTIIRDNESGRYYDAHVQVFKQSEHNWSCFYDAYKEYALHRMCFINEGARQRFEREA